MSIVQTIFDAFGGPTVLANELGEPLSTVHAWKTAKSGIPRWRRGDVLAISDRAKEPLPPEIIAYLRTTQRVAA